MSARPSSAVSPSARVASFDGLRALAVLLVFGAHTVGHTLRGAWVGVDLFFALSGFLITSLLLREHGRTGEIDLRRFYVRRFLRLTPALVVAIAVLTPLAVRAGLPNAVTGAEAALTYTSDVYLPMAGRLDGQLWSHTWSLAVEEQFYLAWPLLLAVVVRRGRQPLPLLLVLMATFVALGSWACLTLGPERAYLSPFPHVPTLLAGAGLAWLIHSGRSEWAGLRSPAVPIGVAAIGAVVVLRVSTASTGVYFGGKAAIGMAAALLVGHLYVAGESRTARLLSRQPLVWLGERSYGFYLYHLPVLLLLARLRLPKLEGMMAAFVAALAATALSWLLVEKPFLRLKNRLDGRA